MSKSPVRCDIIATMKKEMQDVLENNILRFWLDKMQDHENGGFYGRIDAGGVLHPEAEKGAILNARILWAFSAAYRVLSHLRTPVPPYPRTTTCAVPKFLNTLRCALLPILFFRAFATLMPTLTERSPSPVGEETWA